MYAQIEKEKNSYSEEFQMLPLKSSGEQMKKSGVHLLGLYQLQPSCGKYSRHLIERRRKTSVWKKTKTADLWQTESASTGRWISCNGDETNGTAVNVCVVLCAELRNIIINNLYSAITVVTSNYRGAGMTLWRAWWQMLVHRLIWYSRHTRAPEIHIVVSATM